MKKLSIIIFLISLVQVSFAQGEADVALLKTEIKELEKVVKAEEKEIEKLEKSLVSVRPSAEQARRDADNLKAMHDRRKSELEAFQYDKKASTLKANQKALKGLEKDLKSLSKNQTKLDETLSAATRESETLNQQSSSRKAELEMLKSQNNAVSKDEQQSNATLLKSNEGKGTEQHNKALLHNQNVAKEKSLEKELSSIDKNALKADNEIEKTRTGIADNAKRKAAIEQEHADLKASIDALAAELTLMNPKKVGKELVELDKQAKAAELNFTKLQAELDQTTKIINEKHDTMEKSKQLIREKESIIKKQ
jgi:chromosome segregation ATPase